MMNVVSIAKFPEGGKVPIHDWNQRVTNGQLADGIPFPSTMSCFVPGY
jgi:hypothetical protein